MFGIAFWSRYEGGRVGPAAYTGSLWEGKGGDTTQPSAYYVLHYTLSILLFSFSLHCFRYAHKNHQPILIVFSSIHSS